MDYSTGIPVLRVEDWDEPIESWWDRHPFNPANGGGFQPDLVVHPEPRVDVCEFKAGSATGGIEEALATCPDGGCTLWFPKDCGPYVIDRPGTPMQDRYPHWATVQITRRSNLHFLSDGATIAAGENMDGSFMIGLKHMGLQDTGDEGKNLQRNLYFENLVIDGNRQTGTFLNTNGYQDIVWYDVTFVDFYKDEDAHNIWGVVEHVIQPDNVWCIRCRFDSGFHALYWDGIHGGGVVDSVFDGDFQNVPIDIKTNDDASPFSEQPRNTQFFVIAGNEMNVDGHLAAIAFAAANSMIVDNHVTGYSQRFVWLVGKWSGTLEEDLIYQYFGNVIKDNVVEANLSFADIEIQGWGEDLDFRYYEIGQVEIKDNRFLSDAPLLRLNTTHELGAIRSVDLHDNHVVGDGRNAVTIVGGGTVEGIRIFDNVFVDTAQGVDGEGDVTFQNNEWR